MRGHLFQIACFFLLVLFPLTARDELAALREFTRFTALWHNRISLNTASYEYDDKSGILTCYSADKKLYARGPAEPSGTKYTYNGKWRRYYPSGRLLGELSFENSLRSGPAVGYYENGTRALTCSYKGGYLDGRRYRFDKSGRMLDEAHYENGKQRFFRVFFMLSPSFQKPDAIPRNTQYDPEAQIWIFREIGNSRIRTFSTGGILLAEINVRNIGTDNEIYHGRAFFFHDNGILAEKGFYSAGERDGEWQIYSKTGELVETLSYRAGDKAAPLTRPTLP